ncbi:MAG: carboxypeptidase regulatory-like domain-containing protein [Bacteroidetes bacterium]|jgi:hypothetical protein|nr:carboxypeptidase regulatory-like domain-containing protein [Bacteroidota bacterium]
MKRTATAYFGLFVLLTAMALLTSGCSKSNPTGPATGTITGAVTDATTSNPISSATVIVGSLTATTTSQGTYSISHVPAGTDTVAVSANGYLSASKQIQVSSGASETVNFSMEPAATTVSGTVTDATTKTPIGSVVITLGSQSTTTSTQGTYSFSNVAPGGYTVTASGANYISQSKQIQVSPGQPQTVNFSLQPSTTTVSGTITDATTNTTISGATVTLGTQSATTSSGGSYSFSNVQAGNYTVTASANGYNSTSQQIQVSAGVPQTVDLSLQAVQESVPINSTLNAGYYAYQPFSFDAYPFVQCSNGFMSHNVKVTVTVNPTPNPINIIVMRPDGFYKFEVDSTTGGFKQTFESNACGTWQVIVWNYGNAQTTVSGNVSMDFSNYSVSGNDGSAQVQVPINYPSISPGSNGYAYFYRFLKQGMTYNLQLNISGGSGNDINLIIKNPDGSSAFDSRVSGNYTSQTLTATSTGLQLFEFDNSFSVFSSKSVTGSLLINRGTSSENLRQGEAKTVR